MKVKKEFNEKIELNKKRAMCVFMFITTLLLLVGGVALKFFALNFNEPQGVDLALAFLFCIGGIGLILVAFATHVFVSRKELINFPKKLAVMLTTIVFAYYSNVVLASFNYYYMLVALTALVLAPLVARKDVFVANTITMLILLVTLFSNAMYMGVATDDYVALIALTVIDVFVGSIVTAVIPESNKRTISILMGVILESVALALIFSVAINFSYESLISNWVITIICTYAPVLIALMLQPLFESTFNILTNPKLNELTDHSSPLIKRLITEASGTFNHCLAVASYAELCAIAIGENPHLAKACAYYHDVGKLENPKYFGENQGNVNYHDRLLPEVSAEIIRKHTTDGYELCNKYHIPAEIRDITIQHHGTLPMAVFYYKAKKLTDSDVDSYDYEYHGVTPVSKIAAIMMICDAAEAAIRASGKPTAEEVDKLITNIINDRISKHQFDNCDITLKDLNIIKNTIINVYGGHVHSRVKYPSGK